MVTRVKDERQRPPRELPLPLLHYHENFFN